MVNLIERPSAIILNHYKENSVYSLHKFLSVWDNITFRYTQHLFEYEKEDDDDPNCKVGVLRIPRGVGMDVVETKLQEAGIEYKKDNQVEAYRHYRDISFNMVLPPKNEIHESSVKFLHTAGKENHQAFLALDVGRGKTYCTIKHISEVHKPALIISYNLSYQWQEKALQYTDLDNGENGGIVNIVGTQYFRDVTDGKIKPNAALYITSISTIHMYQNMYGKSSIQEIADKLGIGIKVFDEAHNRYLLFNSIDLNMQTDETIYLSATPGRSSKPEDRVFNRIYKNVPSFGSFTSKMSDFYTVKYITYDSFSTAVDRCQMRTPRGMNSLKYTRYLFDKYGNNMMRLMMEEVRPIFAKYPDCRMLIVTDWIRDIKFIKDWFAEHYPIYSVGTYCQLVQKKSDREKELDKQIIIGTIGSMQNGKDIENLQIIFPICCWESPIVTHQLMGRLRQLENRDVYYFDLADISVPNIMKQRRSRDRILRERAKGEIEDDRVDLDRI